MSRTFSESVVEDAALAWLEALGWRIAHGPDIAPDIPAAERHDHGELSSRRHRNGIGQCTAPTTRLDLGEKAAA